MKKFFTLISLLFSCVAMMAQALIPSKYYTTMDELTAATGGFAIVNKAEGKALYGKNAQNLAYDTYENAFAETNSGYLWKLVDADGDGYYLQLLTPAGADYNCWGMGGVLNSQGEAQGWACSFILGISDKRGQDIKDGAVYVLTYSAENEGWAIKNVGTGMYQSFNTLPANNEEPSYFQICSLDANPDVTPEPEEQEVEILASLKSYVENATVFSLKSGDQYLYGSTNQECKMGTYEEATAESNNVNGWILEHEKSRYQIRAVKGGENVNVYGSSPCFLNSQPAITGVTFILAKDQDVKNGSSWYIEEVDGGYTIQNAANKGYLTGLGLSETSQVWEIVLPTTTGISSAKLAAKKVAKSIVDGQLVIVKGNDKFNVAGQIVK